MRSRKMIMMLLFSAAAMLGLTMSSALGALANTNDADPHAALAPAFDAMGGRAQLEAITSIDYTAIGERDLVEQSERPTPPFIFDQFHEHQIRDLVTHRARIERTREAWFYPKRPNRKPPATIINDDVAEIATSKGPRYGGGLPIAENEEQFAFAPERLLLTADSASDLKQQADVTAHGVRHQVFTFSWMGVPCTLLVNADSHLPWQITFTRAYPYQTYWSAWGDVTTHITYNVWSLEPKGIRYPRQWTIDRVGLPDTHLQIMSLQFNPKFDPASLAVSPALYAAHHHHLVADDQLPLGSGGDGPPRTIAPGIIQYPGLWNVEFVQQNDGIVVIEAPWSPNYSQKAFAAAGKMLHARVKAVITTSDSWPHLAGVRQAVADGIPVYALDVNAPILRRLIAASHTMRPDDLQRKPRAPRFHFVTDPITIGSGPNQLQVIPYRTFTGERQMMVYFPNHRLLYTSDLFTPDEFGVFPPTSEYISEALAAIERDHLAPTTIFGMHYGPTPLSTIVKDLHDYVQ